MTWITKNLTPFKVKVVGSTKFGRYKKISMEQTWNMIISDGWLVPFAGYRSVQNLKKTVSRGIFNSARAKLMFVVADDILFTVTPSLVISQVGQLDSFSGDVFIDENEKDQIAITDLKHLYVYNWSTKTFTQLDAGAIDFVPAYIQYSGGFFIAPVLSQSSEQGAWRATVDPLDWNSTANFNKGTFQTKGDNVKAVVRVPGKEGMVLVIGGIVTEPWLLAGGQLFPFQRSSSFNIDYGCLNAATIAASDRFVIWLGVNEKSGPVILYSDGGEPQQISTDGINYVFANLSNPTNCYGFLFKQDGHLIYQFTFPDDNISYIYDFNTESFFNVSDQNQNYHIAKKVVYFNEKYYFISFIDSKIYELSTNDTTIEVNDQAVPQPRIRITEHIRLSDSSPVTIPIFYLTAEEGFVEEEQFIDLSLSYDSGRNFSEAVRETLNREAESTGMIMWDNLGRTNDLVMRFDFWSMGRFVVSDGEGSYFQ